jgi:hypothetical protein
MAEGPSTFAVESPELRAGARMANESIVAKARDVGLLAADEVTLICECSDPACRRPATRVSLRGFASILANPTWRVLGDRHDRPSPS